jgi:hypothetical protein
MLHVNNVNTHLLSEFCGVSPSTLEAVLFLVVRCEMPAMLDVSYLLSLLLLPLSSLLQLPMCSAE